MRDFNNFKAFYNTSIKVPFVFLNCALANASKEKLELSLAKYAPKVELVSSRNEKVLEICSTLQAQFKDKLFAISQSLSNSETVANDVKQVILVRYDELCM